MTVAMAWVGGDSRRGEHLYLASDSRVSGGGTMDACPKIFTLPRSDAALCFAGVTTAAYPLMLQIANAIAAHGPSRDRSMDVTYLKSHVVRLCSDMIARFRGASGEFKSHEVQFILAGFSWLTNDFKLWTIDYSASTRQFEAREGRNFHDRLRKAIFVGDQGTALRSLVMRQLQSTTGPQWCLEPFAILATRLRSVGPAETIGGPPQLIRIARHMNTRVFSVRWKDEATIYGRPLFGYERVDYWSIDPFSGQIFSPPPVGNRPVPGDGGKGGLTGELE
jgi:hypothetical protein